MVAHVEDNNLPALTIDFELNPQSIALLVIDMQNFAVHPDYGWGPILRKNYHAVAQYFSVRLSATVIPNIQNLLESFRKKKLQIIYFKVGSFLASGEDFLKARRRSDSSELIPNIASFGSKESEIIHDLEPGEDEIVLSKITNGCFTATALDRLLRNLHIDTLILTGVHTNNCVETTARQAVDLGYQVVIVEDATAAFDPDSHYAALRTFRRFFGKIFQTEEIIRKI
jgi:nicotinamidase-related amidase